MSNHRSWSFNPQLIADAKFCEYLETHIKLFFETNDKNDISPTLLWETIKACFQSSLKKRNKVKQFELEERIHQLDRDNAQQPSLEKHTEIAALKYEQNKMLSARICRAFIFMLNKNTLNLMINHITYYRSDYKKLKMTGLFTKSSQKRV